MLTTGLSLIIASTLAVGAPEGTQDQPRGPDRATKAGAGLMISGGMVMVTGAGVLVPIALTRAMRTQAPQPANYTSVESFQRDLDGYQAAMHKTMMLGIAGAVTSIVGATVFTAGAVTFGIGRHRARRLAARSSFGVALAPGEARGAFTLRF